MKGMNLLRRNSVTGGNNPESRRFLITIWHYVRLFFIYMVDTMRYLKVLLNRYSSI